MDPVIVETKKKGRKPKVARSAPTPSGLSKTESIVQNNPTPAPTQSAFGKVLNEVSGLVESVQLEEPTSQPTPQSTQPTQVKKQRKVKQDVYNINTDVVSKLKEEKEKEYNEIKELEKKLYLEKIRQVVEEDTKLKSIRQLKDSLKSKIEKEKNQKEKLENETKLVKQKEEIEIARPQGEPFETKHEVPGPIGSKLRPKKERKVVKELKEKPSQEKVASIPTIKSRKDLMKEFGF